MISIRPQGADPHPSGGVGYRTWAPEKRTVDVVIFSSGTEEKRVFSLEKESNGYFTGIDSAGSAGDRYKYRLDGELYPDPVSRWQPDGPNGASMVVDPGAYRWRHSGKKRRPLSDLVLYELHIGTFTPEGIFTAVISRLDALVETGITAIELMPPITFSGERNWGYDGVMMFAPAAPYGHPDDLRELVDAAHERGLNVIIDAVYNHFGPEGNYLQHYSPSYFNPEHKTPWGDAINFDGENAGAVRDLFLSHCVFWMEEFQVDGFRLDATHAILDDSPRHILLEIAQAIHSRDGIVIAEDDRNEAALARPVKANGFGLDGLWADDFHHSVRVSLLEERYAYLGNFSGSASELAEILHHGWLFRGQVAPQTGVKRGTPCRELSPEQFVYCISNHDQSGNRAFGERLHHMVSPAAYRAASALLCLSPYLPLLFMGQEWAASSPFLYFTDFPEELGKKVTEGRRDEFKEFFSAVHESKSIEDIPDPQEEATFQRSKLKWEERDQAFHASMLALYKELLRLRREENALRLRDRKDWKVENLAINIVALRYGSEPANTCLLLIDLKGGHAGPLEDEDIFRLPEGFRWSPVFSSNETRFGGEGAASFSPPSSHIDFKLPEVVLLKPEPHPLP